MTNVLVIVYADMGVTNTKPYMERKIMYKYDIIMICYTYPVRIRGSYTENLIINYDYLK